MNQQTIAKKVKRISITSSYEVVSGGMFQMYTTTTSTKSFSGKFAITYTEEKIKIVRFNSLEISN